MPKCLNNLKKVAPYAHVLQNEKKVALYAHVLERWFQLFYKQR